MQPCRLIDSEKDCKLQLDTWFLRLCADEKPNWLDFGGQKIKATVTSTGDLTGWRSHKDMRIIKDTKSQCKVDSHWQ